jgi:hypothetical protein
LLLLLLLLVALLRGVPAVATLLGIHSKPGLTGAACRLPLELLLLPLDPALAATPPC